MAHPKQLLQEMAQELGIALPEADEDGRYCFLFDGDLDLACLPVGNHRLMLTATVGVWPDDEDAARGLAQHLLRINLARAGSNREVLFLDHQAGELCLYRLLQTDEMILTDFVDKTARFLNNLEAWRSDYARHQSAALHAVLPARAALLFP